MYFNGFAKSRQCLQKLNLLKLIKGQKTSTRYKKWSKLQVVAPTISETAWSIEQHILDTNVGKQLS
jgi:hypothetical protein